MDEDSETIEIKYVAMNQLGIRFGFLVNDLFDFQHRLIEGYKIIQNVSTPTIATRIDDKNVELKEAFHYGDDADVYVVEVKPDGFWSLDLFENQQSWKDIKKRHPSAPVILYEDEYEWKMMEAKGKEFFSKLLKPEEAFINCLCKHKMNESKRNQLVEEYEAVKFVRFNRKSGRGVNILLDEMIYAGLDKIMDERECRKNRCCCDLM